MTPLRFVCSSSGKGGLRRSNDAGRVRARRGASSASGFSTTVDLSAAMEGVERFVATPAMACSRDAGSPVARRGCRRRPPHGGSRTFCQERAGLERGFDGRPLCSFVWLDDRSEATRPSPARHCAKGDGSCSGACPGYQKGAPLEVVKSESSLRFRFAERHAAVLGAFGSVLGSASS